MKERYMAEPAAETAFHVADLEIGGKPREVAQNVVD